MGSPNVRFCYLQFYLYCVRCYQEGKLTQASAVDHIGENKSCFEMNQTVSHCACQDKKRTEDSYDIVTVCKFYLIGGIK